MAHKSGPSLNVPTTFDQRELHRGLRCEVELGPSCALVILLLLGESGDLRSDTGSVAALVTCRTYVSVGRQDLHVADGEDSPDCIPLSLVPVAVHLLLDVHDVALPEGQFPVVLCL